MSRAWGEEFRVTLVCIDSYDGRVLSGHFYNPRMKKNHFFGSTTQFLLAMEEMLDQMELPKAFSLTRTFIPASRQNIGPPEDEKQSGTEATFAIRVLFRQNSSWQGSIVWLEEGVEQSFRSVLELIFLIDNALTVKKVS